MAEQYLNIDYKSSLCHYLEHYYQILNFKINIQRCIDILNQSGLFNESNQALITSHANPKDLAEALSCLEYGEMLIEENVILVATHDDPCGMVRALFFIQQAGLLTPENRAMVADHTNPQGLAHTLFCLQEDEMLTQENLALVSAHPSPQQLAEALDSLIGTGMFTQENFTLVATHASPHYLIRAIYSLDDAEILSQEYFTLVATHPNALVLSCTLTSLRLARILTHENLNTLLDPNHAALVSEQAHQLIWSSIPHHLLNQAIFERLVTAAEHEHPMEELQQLRNQILGVQAHIEHAAPFTFNSRQSTHTASVHRSVSESAVKLMQSYGEHLDIETVIKNIIAFVNSLDSSFTHDAAKRCIARIAAPDYTFTDSSGVSTRQLLALAFTAIHDESKRQGTLGQALALFVEGLYEIQRGSNLNENNIDDKSPHDGNICVAGTFNKIMEKLNGIHPDVEVYFITPEGAYLKFPQVVKEHTLTYLNRLACPETATDYLAIKELLDSMQDNGLEPIWNKIKADDELVLWSEFREAYADNPNHQQFRHMIDYGYSSNSPDLTELYSTLEASPGYQAFLYQLEQRSLEEQTLFLRLQQHSLWANRYESANAQHAFDRRYGLAMLNSKPPFGH